MALIARPGSRAARRLLGGIALLALAPAAWGMCLPLPAPEMHAFDRIAEGDPERGSAEAEARLKSAAPGRDPLVEPQLYPIIAEARGEEGRAHDAHTAVLAAFERLAHLPPAAVTERLRQRLMMSDVFNAETKADLAAAVAAMDEMLTRYPGESIERSCALTSRAESRGELLPLDLATADGTAACRMAQAHGWTGPRIRAAIVVATIYRRSGLLGDAERMIDESSPTSARSTSRRSSPPPRTCAASC